MDFGEDSDAPDSQRKKQHHRHTPKQIQELEATFKECPHPDEKRRMLLSRDLSLEPRQIKFWFQNRRTQMKAQHERADNCTLRSENDKILCENIAIREAMKNITCPTCGGPPVTEGSYFDEQKLRLENARLKEELDRVSSIASKYLGRPITQLSPMQPIPISSLDLSIGSFGSSVLVPSMDLDLLPGNSSSVHQLPFPTTGISEMDKSFMAKMAFNAMEELIRLVQMDEPLWIKSATCGIDVLNIESYNRIFQNSSTQIKNPNVRSEASRCSDMLTINAVALVDLLVDPSKWIDLFPTIVSKARTIEVLASGLAGSRSGSLLLMYEEIQVLSPLVPSREFYFLCYCNQVKQDLWVIIKHDFMYEEIQVLSPLVPSREFYFLRYCNQVKQDLWVISDISVDLPRENQFAPSFPTLKLPSGCLIQDMSNGCSKVSWVVHMKIEEKSPTNRLYRELVNSGMAFRAQRWLATLKRMCERITCLMVAGTSTSELGVIPSAEGKRSMMKLSQRMVNIFCANLSSSTNQRWTSLSGLDDVQVRVSVHKSNDPGQPNGMVLSAATSIWLPVSCQAVFSFFNDENTRSQWDVLSNGNSMQEVAHITIGSDHGNHISLLRAVNSSQNNMLILQESCTDSSGSVITYAPVDLPSINVVMSGEDPSYIPLLPSGFTILPDGRSNGGASTSSNASTGGSLITVAFQILVSSLPSAKLNLESITTVNNLISTTVQQIKAALNCSSANYNTSL